MLDEGQAIVLVNGFMHEAFIWTPGYRTNSDLDTPSAWDNEEPGAGGDSLRVKKLLFIAGKDPIDNQFQKFLPSPRTLSPLLSMLLAKCKNMLPNI